MDRVIVVFKINRRSPMPNVSLIHKCFKYGLAPDFALDRRLPNGRELKSGTAGPRASWGPLPCL